ncbi:MAG: hypothetical protein K2H98_01640 [Duncaniella sp.]|nr:hypothetical protein [Duncaniella sp.]
MTSCLGNGEYKYVDKYTYSDCFNVITNLETGESVVRLSPSYEISIDRTDVNAEITMSSISLPDVMGALSFKITGLKYTFNSRGNYIIQGYDLVPEGSAGSYYTFTNLSVIFVDRVFNEGVQRIPAYYINFTINNKYQVNVVGTLNYYFGETTVTSAGDEEPYSTYDTYYTVSLDPQSMKATLGFNSARFSAAMPNALNFTLREVPFTVTPRGYSIDKADATTPYLNNTQPNPAFDITNLTIDGVTSKGATFTFDCNPKGMGDYHVVAPVEWLIYRPQVEQ